MKQVIYLCLLLFLRFSNLAAQIQSISSVPAFQAWEISLTLACQCFFNSGGAIYIFYLKLCCGEHLSVYRQDEMSRVHHHGKSSIHHFPQFGDHIP